MFSLRTGLRLPDISCSDPSSMKRGHIWTSLQKVVHMPGLWEQAPAWTSGRQYSTSMFSNGRLIHQWPFNIFCLGKSEGLWKFTDSLWNYTFGCNAMKAGNVKILLQRGKIYLKNRVRVSRCNRRDAGGESSASERPAFISCKSVLPFQPIFLMCPQFMPHMFNLNLRQTKDRNTNYVHGSLMPSPASPGKPNMQRRVTQRHLLWQSKLKCWIHWYYNIKSMFHIKGSFNGHQEGNYILVWLDKLTFR